jgi:peptide deformylase
MSDDIKPTPIPETTIRILKDGHPLLAERSLEVEVFDDALRDLIARMVSIAVQHDALGLAAVQIGMPVRVIVGRCQGVVRWMINPVIVRQLRRYDSRFEGCLSVDPEHWRDVSRPAKCEIAWQDAYGEPQQENFTGLWARIWQHEIDHLEGVLITTKES